MQIQINAPHQPLADSLVEFMESTASKDLALFAERLTRVEIHLKDLNGKKGGKDKRCMMEARPSGQSPVAVDHESETIRDAFRGALDKLHRALEHRFGRQSARDRGE